MNHPNIAMSKKWNSNFHFEDCNMHTLLTNIKFICSIIGNMEKKRGSCEVFFPKLKNLLVRTKFYWSWVQGPMLIVRTELSRCTYLASILWKVSCAWLWMTFTIETKYLHRFSNCDIVLSSVKAQSSR
jgi:hypothetical protein